MKRKTKMLVYWERNSRSKLPTLNVPFLLFCCHPATDQWRSGSSFECDTAYHVLLCAHKNHSLSHVMYELCDYEICAMKPVPLSNVWPEDFYTYIFFFLLNFSLLILCHNFVSPHTQHTLLKHQRDGWKPSGAPPSIAMKATEEGSQTHLPSSASIASIVAEEKKRGVAKRMREVSRGVHFVPETSQWAAKAANADNRG